eukprot:CAMPEP_0201666090 /NCGR_PEP_ID=MMETSP0494-20130426/7031_1 /ASSEMBLY_ACC=CAM_ASM_000839 /TAXON_ID=420259 /ORGANISM="Thalassiosira gravida, Strain GMp14c1" /LENGTH=1024 /DNA_ID=CAMNT_0048145175 /DNA_START=50 /DNA_END=3124 /DNA_ORIENTATION=+
MDDSTYVPNRENTSLRLDRNNETVVSGMTERSCETPSVASYSTSAEDAKYTSTSLPPSKFRGSTGRRFGFGSGSSVNSGRSYGGGGGGSVSSRGGGGGRMDRSTRSVFDPIAEEGEGDEASTHGGDVNVNGLGGLGGLGLGGGGGSVFDKSVSGISFGGGGADDQSVVSGISMSSRQVPPSSFGSERSLSSRPTIIPFGSGPDTVISSERDDNRSVSSKPVVVPFGSGPDTVISVPASVTSSSSPKSIQRQGSSVDSRGQPFGKRRVSNDVGSIDSGKQSSEGGSHRDRPAAPFRRDDMSGSVQQRNRNGDEKSVAIWGGHQSVASSQRSRPSIVPNSNVDVIAEEPDEEAVAITHEERAELALTAFDNTRYAMHEPKVEATQEVNVALYQDLIEGADEIASLPEDYVLDSFGNRYHPKKEEGENRAKKDDPLMKGPEFELFAVSGDDEPFKDAFSKKRKWYSLVTICSAVALALVGLCMSIQALSSGPIKYESNEQRHDNNGGYVYLPGHHFGGGIGGIVGGQENERRIQLAYGRYGANLGGDSPMTSDATPLGYAPVAVGPGSGSVRPELASRGTGTSGNDNGARNKASFRSAGGGSSQLRHAAPVDPFGGFGPPQFHPGYGADPIVPSLTAAPLTSYSPPPNDNDDITIVLDPQFNGAFMDLSVLPYNPSLEMPVVLDIPFSGGSAVQAALGHCLRLVQCSKEGAEILSRERELESVGAEGVDARRSLMRMVPDGNEEDRHHGAKLAEEEEGNKSPSVTNNYPMSIADAKENQMDNPDQVNLVVAEESKGHTHNATPFDPPLRTEVLYVSTYVNVDCSSPQGIDRAIAKNLITSNLADVIHSPNMHDVARLFAPPMQAYGRAIVMVRHPIARAVAKYQWLRQFNAEVKEMTLEEFVKSDFAEDNVLTRTIAGRKDLAIAKELLKRKFLVGLFDRMDASIERLEIFLHWNNISDDARSCQQAKVNQMMANSINHNLDLPLEGSPVWISLMEKNGLDMALFEYAKFLYDYQGHTLFGIPVSSV